MGDWPRVTLGEICDAVDGVIRTGPFGSQLHRSDYVDDPAGLPVVMPKDIVDGRIVDSSIARIGAETVARLSHHRLQIGDIVMARRGDIGRRALVDSRTAGWLCGTGSLRISLAGGDLDPVFLYYFMGSDETVGWLQGQAVGATMSNLNTDIVRRIEVPLPPLSVQRKIAAVLAAYDELIENNLRRIEILEEMAQAVYREWFVNFRYPGHENVPLVDSPLGAIPEGWEAARFGTIAVEVREGVEPSALLEDERYVGLEHIPRESFTLTDSGSIADVKSRKWRFEAGDVLFGRLRPYFHKVALAPFDGACSTDAIVIRPEAGFEELVLQVAFSKEFVAHAVTTSGGTDRPRAKWGDLANFPIVLPPRQLRQAFSDAVRPIVNLTQVLARQNANLRSTRDLLLPKLVSGEIDVSDLDIDTDWLVA